MDKAEIKIHVEQLLQHVHRIKAELEADEPDAEIIFGQAFHIEMNGRQIKQLSQANYINQPATT